MRSLDERISQKTGRKRVRKTTRTKPKPRKSVVARRRRKTVRHQSLWARMIRIFFPSKTHGAIILGVSALLISGLLAYGLGGGDKPGSLSHGVITGLDQLAQKAGFSVQEITITGRVRTKPDQIMAVLGTASGGSILLFDADQARLRLEDLEWVKAATISKFLPDTIHVTLVERIPYAIWQKQGRHTLIARDGTQLTSLPAGQYRQLPHVVGAGVDQAATDLFALIDEVAWLKPHIGAFVRVGNRRWKLHLKTGIEIELPEQGIETALAKLTSIQQDHDLLSRDIVLVDMRLPDRVTVRLSDTALGGWQKALQDYRTVIERKPATNSAEGKH